MSQQLLPQSSDAERGLLSSFLCDPAAVGSLCAARKVGPEHFASSDHAAVFGHLVRAWQEGVPLDFIMLTQRMRDAGELDDIGQNDQERSAWIMGIFLFVPTAARAEHYIEILKSKHALRKIIMACRSADERSYQHEDPEKVAAELAASLAEISAPEDSEIPTMKQNVVAACNALMDAVSEDSCAVRTGLRAIDEDAGPVERGNLLVIGGQRKAGKSILATQMALNIAQMGKPVIFFSLEMNEQELTLRMISSLARVETRKVRIWTEGDYRRYNISTPALADIPMHIVCKRYDLSEIAGICRQFHSRYSREGQKLACVVLDYAQLVSAPGKDERRQQEVAAVSRMAKRLASELDVLFILLTQLNDDGRAREARDIEMDANMMLEVGCDEKSGERGVRVVCARSAPSGEHLKLRIIPNHTRVEDAE